jgi:HEAT repeat protein
MTLFSLDFLTLFLLVVTFTSLGLLVAMIGLRIIRKFHEQHLARLDVRVRPIVLSIAVAENEELPELFVHVSRLRIFARQQAITTAFRMLTEVSGESRRNLAALMIDQGVVKKSLRRVSSLDPVRRARAAELLGLVNPPEALEVLARLTKDRSREVRIVAVRGLGRTQSDAATALIERVLQQPRTAPTWLTGSALLELDTPQQFPLKTYLSHPSPVVRQVATTLGSLMPQADTGILLGRCVLEDDDRLVRVMAARALARLQSRAGVEPLSIAAMSDPHRSVRVAAALALSQLPQPWTRDALVYLQASSVEPAVRRAALPIPVPGETAQEL